MSRYCKILSSLPVIVLFAICFAGIPCRAEGNPEKPVENVFQSITPTVAAQLIVEKENLMIVDVRTPAERDQAAIENSILIPVRQVLQGNHSFSKKEPVLVYCAVGGRSFYAAKYLISRGYEEVYNLAGGIDAWLKAGLPVIKEQKGPSE